MTVSVVAACSMIALTSCATTSSTPAVVGPPVVSSGPGVSSSDANNRDGPYHVVHVVDGDTFDVLIGGQKTRVRVIGINSPESVDPRRAVQCFGPEASLRAKELLAGKSVWLEEDPTQGVRDTYGRKLAFAWLNDEIDFGRTMIEGGFATEFTYRLPYRYRSEYRQAQAAARSAGRGLWSTQTCSGNYRR